MDPVECSSVAILSNVTKDAVTSEGWWFPSNVPKDAVTEGGEGHSQKKNVFLCSLL
jgi:hypothetical protein